MKFMRILALAGVALVCIQSSGDARKGRPNMEVKNFFAEEPQEGALFGASVAIDGNYAIVGAPGEAGDWGSVPSSGAAYIYERDETGTWVQVAALHASDLQENDCFGHSVAIQGDIAVVGAPFEDGVNDMVSASGAAYVFVRDVNGNWNEEIILRPSDPQAGSCFGYSAAFSGDYVLVGAPCKDLKRGITKLVDAGSVYYYQNVGDGEWAEAGEMCASDKQEGDLFGLSVATWMNRAIVGAPTENGGAGNPVADAGAAYIFEMNDGGVFAQKAILHASDMGRCDQFGYAVAMCNNVVMVGATYEDGGDGSSYNSVGAVYEFEPDKNTGKWTEQTIIHALDMFNNAYFGNSIGVFENTAIVGAYGSNNDNAEGYLQDMNGSAYILQRNISGLWRQTELLTASDLNSGDNFGEAVAICHNAAIVGALHKDTADEYPLVDVGGIYFFE